eukprot:9308090-Karenia_brevis.AAC.1
MPGFGQVPDHLWAGQSSMGSTGAEALALSEGPFSFFSVGTKVELVGFPQGMISLARWASLSSLAQPQGDMRPRSLAQMGECWWKLTT